ncbi:asparaginyl/glutamyl-tRNA amidotransferase subunit C [Snodgrassella alvi]|jgi:aspartyl-tRNA(Asn)/glutamyl-tRNA(Gln) amidotransferase subunit C|uniref:Aspartyl/glutamyl-tRNA(Asn/Gln) amidotransferase subunit C n=1 Tax=Snodgrassella alvi TaxID=1196083 RepID=A0A2N9XZ19_9NEIS|nr:Asp-tRNA(Asn)/Glu-tRNA(Gln) amidotransferase subunit GatC [Snodgrassella alvi]PIT52179.1 asparaginyl/glutamyl-tRNA amidotransferase subunit C [Snodgrassella alvi]PIT56168.1 asparaginyl/glutamyl-tRNA amidotransferase subunit C [Snodgrassella alvi]
MALTLSDVDKLARLSRLSLSETERNNMLAELNHVFDLVEKMQEVNTDGVEPMAHPHEVALRLRDDCVTEKDVHSALQSCAPLVDKDMYLVPKVIE